MHKLVIPLAILLIILCVTAGYHWTHAIRYSDTDPAFNRAYWEQQIQRHGAKDAYAEFKERTEKAPLARQHFAAHVMGDVLAEKLGTEGITVCDTSFAFGCFHGLFSAIIAKEGTAVIKELDAACVKAYGVMGTGCTHGIGHGILEYVGYENVAKALELCGLTTQKVPLLGCTSGVFMEYNQPLGGDPQNLVPGTRPFDPTHPYMPCTHVPQQFQASCYFELGGWLRTSISDDAAKRSGVCAGLSGEPRSRCYMGIGSGSAHEHGYDMTASLAECAALAPADEFSCRAGVRWGFYQVPETRVRANEACAYADAQQSACASLGDLTRG